MIRYVCWFSHGAASAVATKLHLAEALPGSETAIVTCHIDNEHADNARFRAECERWFGQKIDVLRSDEYKDCWDVWTKRKYLAGVNGAPCTLEMKKAVRWAFERSWLPDYQIFGFTTEEEDREEKFEKNNPDVSLMCPLIDHRMTKADCFKTLAEAGIELPAMYKLGYANNNCIGCVKGGTGYWNKIRVDFPEVFARMAKLERTIGATVCKLGSKGRPRVYLDELDPKAGRRQKPQDMDCGVLCASSGAWSPPPRQQIASTSTKLMVFKT
jgi:hypothetical protein